MMKLLIMACVLVACGPHDRNRAAVAVQGIDSDIKCDDWARGSAADTAYCAEAGYLLRCVAGDDASKTSCRRVADLRALDEAAKPAKPAEQPPAGHP